MYLCSRIKGDVQKGDLPRNCLDTALSNNQKGKYISMYVCILNLISLDILKVCKYLKIYRYLQLKLHAISSYKKCCKICQTSPISWFSHLFIQTLFPIIFCNFDSIFWRFLWKLIFEVNIVHLKYSQRQNFITTWVFSFWTSNFDHS